MTDGTLTPEQQAAAAAAAASAPPGQQVAAPPAVPTPAGPPAGYVEQARYTGLIQKVDELTRTIQAKDQELATLKTSIEQLQGQLGVKDAEGHARVAELERQLQTNTEAHTSITQELSTLRDFKAKVEAAMAMNRPDLIRIATQIPLGTDPSQFTTLLTDIAGFQQAAVQTREAEIFSGVTQAGGGVTVAPATPTSPEGWSEYVEKFPLGSPERAKALGAYGDWIEAQHRG